LSDFYGPDFQAMVTIGTSTLTVTTTVVSVQMLDGQGGSINNIDNFACVGFCWHADGPGWSGDVEKA